MKNKIEKLTTCDGGYQHTEDGSKYIPMEEFAPTWYAGLCSKEEIDRIIKIKTPADYLLKMRADQLLDNVRLYRVILHRDRYKVERNNLASIFNDAEFENYYNLLPEVMKNKCKMIDKGFIFSNDPNGSYMRTSYGDLIIVSEALKYFLYYMNLAFLDFDNGIPEDVIISSLIIAIRIMLKNEALDFDMDPRGIIPKSIDIVNSAYVQEQVGFVIGHEYSHYLLEHLDEQNVYSKLLWGDEDNNEIEYKFYNHSQLQEFDADVASVLNPTYDESFIEIRVQAAILFFIYIDIYQQAKEQIYPSISSIKTHPEPIDRIWNIYEKTKCKLNIINEEYINKLIYQASMYKKVLEEHIGYNMDTYEGYGSVYLGSWRGKPLRDRIDY